MQKLQVNTFARIELPDTNPYLKQDKKNKVTTTHAYYVKSYSKEERRYCCVNMEHQLGYSLDVREKAIISVSGVRVAAADLHKWGAQELLALLSYEINLVGSANNMQRGSDKGVHAWEKYIMAFSRFRVSPSPQGQVNLLSARRVCYTARLTTHHGRRLSRTTSRRLRKKGSMRNSSRGYRTSYATPNSVSQEYIKKKPGISTKISKKREKVPETNPNTTDTPSGAAITVTSAVGTVATNTLLNSDFYIDLGEVTFKTKSTTGKKKRRNKKKLAIDIPF